MMEFNKKNEFVYEIHYDISLSCNNRCSYCYQLPYLDNSKLFDHKVYENVIEQINKFKEQNPDYRLEIFIKGGEPLLVIDKVVEFISGVYTENVTNIHIYTNLNFKPKGSKILKLIKYHNITPFNIIVSVHESSNLDWVKQNITHLTENSKGKHSVDIISEDSSIDFVIDFSKWMLEKFGPKTYSISEITRSGVSFLNYDDPKLYEVLINQYESLSEVCIDDKIYTTQETIKLDFKNISKQYMTTCKINACSIRYDGTLKTLCQHPWTSKITNGIQVQKVFCNNYTCTCNLNSYKQLIRKKR